MKISEYIKQAKVELDDMEKMFLDGNKKQPKMWPLEISEGEWVEQELATRFEQI